MKGISRIDSHNTHGWFVRIYRNGETISKLFSDNRYDGADAALKAALNYKERLAAKYPPPLTGSFRTRPQKNNNTTGVAGVSETFMRSRSGEKIPCFTVSWRPRPNVSRTKKFSIIKYGRERAFEMAIAFRKKKEAEMLKDGQPPSSTDQVSGT